MGTIEVGATSVPRELVNVRPIHFCPDPCSSSGMGWMSPHGGHTLKPRRAGGGTTEGKPLRSGGTRPHTPETPRKGGPGRSCSFLRSCARARTAGRAGTGPGTPRPLAQTPAESEPKAKGARRRVPAAPTLRPRGGRRAPPSPRGRRFVTSLVSQQARAARAPPTPGRPPASPPAASLRFPRFPASGAGPALPSRSLGSGRRLRTSTCAAPAPRARPRRA